MLKIDRKFIEFRHLNLKAGIAEFVFVTLAFGFFTVMIFRDRNSNSQFMPALIFVAFCYVLWISDTIKRIIYVTRHKNDTIYVEKRTKTGHHIRNKKCYLFFDEEEYTGSASLRHRTARMSRYKPVGTQFWRFYLEDGTELYCYPCDEYDVALEEFN